MSADVPARRVRSHSWEAGSVSMIMQWDAVSEADAEVVRSLEGDAFFEWLERYEERLSFDVDKAWHALHFTLTGDAWETRGPLGEVVLGGEPFGEDVGYGPPRWLSAEAVSGLAEGLAALSPQQFESQIDFAALARNEVYPSIWDRDPDAEQLIEFVRGAFEGVRDGFAEAARMGSGFVISLL
jgi:hypothetical protein